MRATCDDIAAAPRLAIGAERVAKSVERVFAERRGRRSVRLDYSADAPSRAATTSHLRALAPVARLKRARRIVFERRRRPRSATSRELAARTRRIARLGQPATRARSDC